MNSALMFSKASDEWSTPQDFFDALDAEFMFLLDAAATDQNAKANTFLTIGDDALNTDWLPWITDGDPSPLECGMQPTVWLNPPYSKCREFIAKAAAEARKGCTVVCLVPSRTDTRWWHEHV